MDTWSARERGERREEKGERREEREERREERGERREERGERREERGERREERGEREEGRGERREERGMARVWASEQACPAYFLSAQPRVGILWLNANLPWAVASHGPSCEKRAGGLPASLLEQTCWETTLHRHHQQVYEPVYLVIYASRWSPSKGEPSVGPTNESINVGTLKPLEQGKADDSPRGPHLAQHLDVVVDLGPAGQVMDRDPQTGQVMGN